MSALRRWPALLVILMAAAPGAQPAAAIDVSEDVPVPAGTAAIAQELGLDTVPDRARFVGEVTRLVHDSLDRKNAPPEALRQRLRRMTIEGRSTERVPVPLTTSVWGEAVFHRQFAPVDLIATILGDRQASLLCHGLSSLDTETLQYLGDHPPILTSLYQSSAAAFGAFAGSLHIRGDRVVPPGGNAAIELWEAVVGQKVTSPDRFVTALFAQADGRVAYLYDSISQLDSARRAFALGLWIADPAVRLDAMKGLTTAWVGELRAWRLQTQPFTRPPYDAASMLMRMRVDPSGAPAPPFSLVLWTHAVESLDLPSDPAGLLARTNEREIGAAWLVETTGGPDMRQRADRLDQIAFGQRAFASASAADMPDVLVALRAFPRYRMLMLTLDRMGIKTPSVYAAAARRATNLSALSQGRAFVATAEFQGALALLSRMVIVRTIPEARAEALAARLVALPLTADGRYEGAVTKWLAEDLRPAIGRAGTMEASLVAALSGPAASATAPRLQWEGQPYRLDLGAAERRRLERVREKQGGPPIDLALDLADAARTLASPSLTLDQLQATTTRLQVIASDHAGELKRVEASSESLPSNVDPPQNVRDGLGKAVDEVMKSSVARDVRRAARVAGPLVDLSDDVAAQTLASIAYAIDIGDPGGPALLAGDVSRRHDFGFREENEERRVRTPWALPHRDVTPGQPWHVDGSLLGLDVALAPLALRRVNTDRVPAAPTLVSTAREALAQSVALMNPFALDNAGRDAIAEAITRGERRVAALLSDPKSLDLVADAIEMDGGRRRATAWALVHEPDQAASMFSLRELLQLGDPGRDVDLGPWGMAALLSSGCLCTEMPPLGRPLTVAGRPQLGLTAGSVADLNLHVARMMNELGLPAPLAKYVLGAAVQDFMDEVRPTDADDWLTLARAARLLSRERIEDYIAAVTAGGPLVPDNTTVAESAR